MTSGGKAPRKQVLDTSAYSHLRRGDEQLIAALAEAELILVPAVVLGELEAAFRMGSRARENLQRLEDFLALVEVIVVPVDAEVAARFGKLVAQLRASGTPLPTNDIRIAAAP